MPATRHHIWQCGTAHEARKHPMAAGYLLCGGAKEHHGIGTRQSGLRAKGKFALAWSELGFNRTQWQAELFDAAAENFQRRIEHVVPRLGEILITLRKQTHLWGFRWPRRIGRREARI